jgi:putative colanic acid biosynthesis acetyltransferase WcaF
MDLEKFNDKNFDRGASLFREVAWIVIKTFFFLPSWPMPSVLRANFLKLFGARIGRKLIIRSGVDITFPWRFEAGDNVWIGEAVRIVSLADVKLGSNVCISQEAFLCTGSHDHLREDFALISKPISIGSQVWVAARAWIGPGVTIGSNSVIAAGAVVVRDVESNCVMAGVPATLLSRKP